MPIDTTFKFGHVVAARAVAAQRLAAAPAAAANYGDPRGLLAGLVGDLPLAARVRTIPSADGPVRVST